MRLRLFLSPDRPWLILGVFALLVGAFALEFHMHYPDESYYRDAVIRMLENGDYLTPYRANGDLRFNKPILTYWVVLAGFELFGVGEFGARIFFLLAGVFTIGLTFWMGKVSLGNSKFSTLTAWILASNPVFILAATRSIPDILLVCTMSIAYLGFFAFLRWGSETPRLAVWAVYLGLSLAVAVKGLPGIALGGLGIIYLLFNPWRPISWQKLSNFPALFSGILLAFFWYAIMWKIHGEVFLAGFWEDQVGVRVASRILLIIQNGLLAILGLCFMFLPWLLFSLSGLKKRFRFITKEEKSLFGFIFLLGLAMIGMTALTSRFSYRYLLPVTPLISVGFAWLLTKGQLNRSLQVKKVFVLFVIGVLAVLLSISCWLFWKNPIGFWIGLQLALAVLLLFFLVKSLSQNDTLPMLTSVSILLFFFVVSTVTRHFSFPLEAEQIKEQFDNRKTEYRDKLTVGFLGNPNAGSRIRLMLFPQVVVVDLKEVIWEKEIIRFQELIVEDKWLEKLDLTQYEVLGESLNAKSSAIPQLALSFGTSSYHEELKENGKRFYWLKRL